jgi:hypothetical protein
MVYIGAAIFAGRSIYNAMNEQRFEARQEFEELTDFAARAGALGFFTEEYIEDIRAQLDLSNSIDALIIDGPHGRAAFEKKSGLISYNGDYPNFNENAWLYDEPQTTPLRTDGGIAVSISSLSPLVDFGRLLSTMRLSFLAILVAVTLAFAILVADISIVKPATRPAPSSDENSAVMYNNGNVTFLSTDEAPSAPSVGEFADVPLIEEVADIQYEGEDADIQYEGEDADIRYEGEDADIQYEKEKALVQSNRDDVPSIEEVAAVPSIEEVAAVPSIEEVATVQSIEEETGIPSLGEEAAGIQSGREDAVNESPDEYEELEELKSYDYGVPFDEYGEAGKPYGGGGVAGGLRDEYEELEELYGDEEAGEPAFAPPEKNTAGTGLLATAKALYRKDGFDSMDENTEFHEILQQELTKAEKADEDLVVMSVEGTNVNFPSEALIKKAADFFKTGSRFFEKDDGTGVYIIVPDASLNEIFVAAKDFYRQAVLEARSRNSGAELLIGMSARSTRTVTGINFLNEAERALYKARSDKTLPIVGFKADPQKYKDFIDRA